MFEKYSDEELQDFAWKAVIFDSQRVNSSISDFIVHRLRVTYPPAILLLSLEDPEEQNDVDHFVADE